LSQPPPAQTGHPHPGLILAAILFGVAAVIGAVAMVIFAAGGSLTARPAGGAVVLTEPQAPVTGTPADVAAPAPAPQGATLEAPSGPTASGGSAPAVAPAMPGDGLSIGTATPTAGPGAASRSGAATQVLEDWSGYPDVDALRAAYSINDGWAAGNDLSLMPHDDSATLAYTIVSADPNADYVGMERDLAAPQDWRGYKELTTTVRTADRSARQLVLQFHEWSGEVWKHTIKLSDLPADGVIRIPLTPDQWTWADWSERQNKQLDFNEITHFGVFIGHAGPGSGQLEIGPLAVQR
jgi:hypothetical protein